jgi:hypothetical protein
MPTEWFHLGIRSSDDQYPISSFSNIRSTSSDQGLQRHHLFPRQTSHSHRARSRCPRALYRNLPSLTGFQLRWRILIFHGEALLRIDLHTEVTGAAFEAIDLQFYAIFCDLDGIGRAAPAAHPAENALIDIHFNSAPRNRGETPLLFRVHERGGPAQQVLGHGFGHCKQSHFLDLLPPRWRRLRRGLWQAPIP